MTPPDIAHTWTWTGDRTLPAWLDRHHRWHQDRPVIHTADGPRTLHIGWLVALWTDDAITVGSATVADRVYGPNGIAGRLQRAEARARELERHLREADAENLELAAHNDRTCEAVQRRDAAEAAVARLQAAVASFDGRGVLAIGRTNPDVPTAREVLDAVRAALDGEQQADAGTEFVRQADQPDVAALTPAVESRLAQSGIHTPGCDCGHDGMGVSWHGDDCGWRRRQVDPTA